MCEMRKIVSHRRRCLAIKRVTCHLRMNNLQFWVFKSLLGRHEISTPDYRISLLIKGIRYAAVISISSLCVTNFYRINILFSHFSLKHRDLIIVIWTEKTIFHILPLVFIIRYGAPKGGSLSYAFDLSGCTLSLPSVHLLHDAMVDRWRIISAFLGMWEDVHRHRLHTNDEDYSFKQSRWFVVIAFTWPQINLDTIYTLSISISSR